MTTVTDSNTQDMQQANAAIGINLMGVGAVFLADNFIARQPLGIILLALGAAVFFWSRRSQDYAFFTLGLALAGVGLWFLIAATLNLNLLGLALGGNGGPGPVTLAGIGLPLALMALGGFLYIRKAKPAA